MQEAFDLAMSPALVEKLEETKEKAAKADKRRTGLAPLGLGDEAYHVRATGTKGYRWLLECDDYLILFANPDTDWPVSVRYTAAGLWEHGVEALRTRALRSLGAYTTPNTPDHMRVTRADYCYDFHSPAFTDEMREMDFRRAVICHSSAKITTRGETFSTWGRPGRTETGTIGSKSALQVEVYDKSLEITEASGKTWFYELWARGADGELFDSDVHRVEIRMAGDFLKERNVRRSHELMALRPQLITEAMYTRRLTDPSAGDSNRRRWPLHPLWSEVVRQCDAPDMVPLGRRVTGRRDALVEKAVAQIAGTILSTSVLAFGEFDEAKMRELLGPVWNRITHDPDYAKKVAQLQLRYEDVEEAQ
ncbi:MAG: hypothetical protein KGL39_53065 [Patescibacteria group bacterium]|nr:hypothetical protein [Patescibacteria group bacterium]